MHKMFVILSGAIMASMLTACSNDPYVATQFPANYEAFDPTCGDILRSGAAEGGGKAHSVCARLKGAFEKIQTTCQSRSGWRLGMRGVAYRTEVDAYNSCMRSTLFENQRSQWVPRPSGERKDFRNLVGVGCSKELGC